MESILSVKNLNVSFTLRGESIKVIRDVSIDVKKGETLAIVGESGSGKSVFCKALMGLLDLNGRIDSGEILYGGRDLAKIKSEKSWLGLRGSHIAIVMQDPMTSLNPLIPIGKQLLEAVRLHQSLPRRQAYEATLGYLNDVGIPDPKRRFRQYPHEFSGGMRQRVVIAMAIACNPKILICDEPTTAIDVTIQAQILELLQNLKEKYQLTTIYITHDLGVVAHVADRIAVMYAGDFVEMGNSEEVFYNPIHPYTWALLLSMPQLARKGEDIYSIEGSPPNMKNPLSGDAFAPRNRYALKMDFAKRPPLFSVSETHQARTWLLDPRAPKIEPLKRFSQAPSAPMPLPKPVAPEAILEVKNLTVCFGNGSKRFAAVNDVSFRIMKGETFGVAGESGSGKTTLGRAILRIYSPDKGEVLFKGKKISGALDKNEDLLLTRSMQMIFQDPMSSLNERAKVSSIVSEGLKNIGVRTEALRQSKVQSALLEVGLRPEFADRFPHEFSGGQRQRVGIARAMVIEPEFLVADEPISALDVSIRAQVLNLMSRLQREKGLSYLFISHDLSVMRHICNRIAAMHRGVMVELAETNTLFMRPMHPYTRSLLSAITQPDPKLEKSKVLITYDPSVHSYEKDKPSWREVEPGHFVHCNGREEEEYRKMYSL
jgi:oligopeptide/dipeptide ABC transporter ATP-binding protein